MLEIAGGIIIAVVLLGIFRFGANLATAGAKQQDGSMKGWGRMIMIAVALIVLLVILVR